MDIAELEDQHARLILPAFNEDTALQLGLILVEIARTENLPVVINIRTPDRTLFHVALAGAAPLNDRWALRKSNTALHYQTASLLVGRRMAVKGDTLATNGLSEAEFAVHGGSVPIRVQSVGVVAAATVSGLPQVDDHALVVRALERLIAEE